MSAWEQVVTRLRGDAKPKRGRHRPLILESWRRSRDAGIDPDKSIELRRVDLPELLRRQSANRSLLNAATDLIDRFSTRMGMVKHVVYMTDADGIVLYSRGNEFIMQSYGLRPGFDWSELQMGTNGAGTALASGTPVAVLGPDHWLFPFRDASCLAAPIHSPEGELVGAVDLCSHVSDCDPAQLDEVIALAHEIEAQLRG